MEQTSVNRQANPGRSILRRIVGKQKGQSLVEFAMILLFG